MEHARTIRSKSLGQAEVGRLVSIQNITVSTLHPNAVSTAVALIRNSRHQARSTLPARFAKRLDHLLGQAAGQLRDKGVTAFPLQHLQLRGSCSIKLPLLELQERDIEGL